jgi:hypothetical protein
MRQHPRNDLRLLDVRDDPERPAAARSLLCAARDEVCFVTSQPESADWITRESWSTRGNLDELQAAFGQFHADEHGVLARALNRFGSDNLERALEVYERVRKPRTSVVQAGSSANTWMRAATNPDWLFGYDAWNVPL